MGNVIIAENKGKVDFFEFPTDQSQVAPVIYKDLPHRTTNMGIIVNKEITRELRRFLREFTNFLCKDWPVVYGPYYRIDAYFDEQSITILEVNTNFVDGWGTALNLSRASKINIDSNICVFPEYFVYLRPDYLPELELLIKELKQIGVKTQHEILRRVTYERDILSCFYNIVDIDTDGIQAYHYFRTLSGSVPSRYIIPYGGRLFDNKSNLAGFSRNWLSQLIKIPTHYQISNCQWQDLPNNVVLKFSDKDCDESLQSWYSVFIGKPLGKRPSIKRFYNKGIMLAQEQIEPTKIGSNNCQLVILAIGASIVSGYVQYSPKAIITDDSLHGPLWIEQ